MLVVSFNRLELDEGSKSRKRTKQSLQYTSQLQQQLKLKQELRNSSHGAKILFERASLCGCPCLGNERSASFLFESPSKKKCTHTTWIGRQSTISNLPSLSSKVAYHCCQLYGDRVSTAPSANQRARPDDWRRVFEKYR